jgi:hypothetical protein
VLSAIHESLATGGPAQVAAAKDGSWLC